MTWVKICGITNLEDALVAAEAGVDALGFVFYEKSPRNVAPQQARVVTEQLPDSVQKIGVFVNPDSRLLASSAEKARLSGVQLHADIDGRFTLMPDDPVFQDFDCYIGVPSRLFLNDVGEFEDGCVSLRSNPGCSRIRGILLDSGTPSQIGGTGIVFDWASSGTAQAVDLIRSAGWNLILAGGLTPANVAEAMSILHPWGVDVSSGVESRPGKKDPEKVRAFIRAVREADKANQN